MRVARGGGGGGESRGGCRLLPAADTLSPPRLAPPVVNLLLSAVKPEMAGGSERQGVGMVCEGGEGHCQVIFASSSSLTQELRRGRGRFTGGRGRATRDCKLVSREILGGVCREV